MIKNWYRINLQYNDVALICKCGYEEVWPGTHYVTIIEIACFICHQWMVSQAERDLYIIFGVKVSLIESLELLFSQLQVTNPTIMVSIK